MNRDYERYEENDQNGQDPTWLRRDRTTKGSSQAGRSKYSRHALPFPGRRLPRPPLEASIKPPGCRKVTLNCRNLLSCTLAEMRGPFNASNLPVFRARGRLTPN